MNFENEKIFNFKLDNKNIWEVDYKLDIEEKKNTTIRTYNFLGGIKVTNIIKRYEMYNAYEWVNYYENTGDIPTDIISDLWDCYCTLPMKHEESKGKTAYLPDINEETKIYTPNGSTSALNDFECNPDEQKGNKYVNHIYPGQTKRYSTSGGRSSDGHAPFFNINKGGMGYVFAIGWSGQWMCEVEREEDSIHFRSKIENTYFRIMPGEKFRASSIVIMPYEGDFYDANNKWRRMVKEEFSLIGRDGREQHGPLCTSIWGGMKSSSILERLDAINKNKLPFEYIWMDAGWSGISTKPSPDEYEGDWFTRVGDWRVSPLIHPGGLKDVSKTIHDMGMKFLLWFEPERGRRNNPVAIEHPEYFLSGNNPNNPNRLLNLGDKNAWNYCFNTISELIEQIGIDCYRQDFNFAPLEYWNRNDDPDRMGITEIKHINGMYALWDALLEKFPNLIIDNCASGGRRIDIETLRRSVPLFRSDFQCPANYHEKGSQCHHMNYNMWMPYSGNGGGRIYDEYRIRSAYASSLTTNYFYSEKESYCDTPEKVNFMKKYTEEYLRVRPYFSEDFYPLTEYSEKEDVWCAMQFDRPAEDDGIIQVFKRENSPYETARFFLRGIDINKQYLFTDIDEGEFVISGKELKENGLLLKISEKRKAKIYFYKKI